MVRTARAMQDEWSAFEQGIDALKGLKRGRLRLAVVTLVVLVTFLVERLATLGLLAFLTGALAALLVLLVLAEEPEAACATPVGPSAPINATAMAAISDFRAASMAMRAPPMSANKLAGSCMPGTKLTSA